MRISPLNIKRQEFTKSMRGYDKDEVEAFLSKLADEFEKIQEENETLNKEYETAIEKLKEFKRIEKNLQDTLLKATESSSKSIESTKKQSSLMIKEAEVKASQILEKAREDANAIRNAVVHLRDERDLILSKLKSIINSQVQLLELKFGEQPESSGEVDLSNQKKLDIDVDDIINKLL